MSNPDEYFLYVHSSKESAYRAAIDAGFSEAECEDFGLMYAGYEVRLKITVDRKNRTFKEEIVND